ncbi:MAG: COX15/CtaA family protein [Bacteroidetes bacterium]|nr:COX15/CtaA family protein [Bacteroidota bacterium]
MKNNPHRSIIIWLFAGCFLVYAMVVIGGITRLTHSGLSMVEWNPIIGSLPPISDADWQAPFEKYKQTPEYQIVNNQFTLDEFKSIYWWEYSHRLLGRTIGLVFLIPFFYFLKMKKFDRPLLKKMFILLILGALQGFLGWFMVKSGLQKSPHVSHYRLATHLISAFTIFGFTFWYALDLLYPKMLQEESAILKNIKKWARIMFGVIILQIIYGAFVAGLRAGLIYNTYPTMLGSLMPESVTSFEPFWKNFLENPSGIQFLHRNIALVVTILVLFVWEKSRKLNLNSLQRKSSNFMLIVLGIQFTLGVITLLYAVPVALGVLHQTGAFFLFASALFFMHSLRRSA